MNTIINCQQVAQRIGATPKEADAAVLAHIEQCAECTVLYSKLNEFDQVLSAALNIDVPENLSEGIFANTADQDDKVVSIATKQAKSSERKPRHYRSMAIAASLVLGIGLVLGGVIGRLTAPLPEALVAHVKHEPDLLTDPWSLMPANSVQKVLNSGGVSLNGDIGDVRHASLCYFRGNKVPHVVVHTSSGPVTLMLLPHVSVDSPTSFSEDGYQGILIPVNGGSIGIIGNQEESVIKVREQVKDKVSWRI